MLSLSIHKFSTNFLLNINQLEDFDINSFLITFNNELQFGKHCSLGHTFIYPLLSAVNLSYT